MNMQQQSNATVVQNSNSTAANVQSYGTTFTYTTDYSGNQTGGQVSMPLHFLVLRGARKPKGGSTKVVRGEFSTGQRR